MKFVCYTEPVHIWKPEFDALSQQFPQAQFILPDTRRPSDVASAHAFVGGIIPPDHFVLAKQLKFVFVNFAGPDMMPLADLKKRGIRLSNTHGNARWVAERAVALALSVYGKINAFHNDLIHAKWHGLWGKGPEDTWESIYGKTCAIIGTGAIGKWIAKYLKSFDCHIIGFKKRPVADKPENFDEITLDLSEALEKGELILNALPATPATKGLIGEEALLKMEGKVLVNVGRGDAIDEKGLYNALQKGILKGAGIDVWYDYPKPGGGTGYPSKYPFHELKNIVLSPHVAGFTSQAMALNLHQTIDNIRFYLDSGDPVYELDLNSMY